MLLKVAEVAENKYSLGTSTLAVILTSVPCSMHSVEEGVVVTSTLHAVKLAVTVASPSPMVKVVGLVVVLERVEPLPSIVHPVKK